MIKIKAELSPVRITTQFAADPILEAMPAVAAVDDEASEPEFVGEALANDEPNLEEHFAAMTERLAAGDQIGARALATELREEYSNSSALIAQIGQGWLRAGSPVEAEIDIGRALELDSNNADAWYILGVVRETLGQHNTALDALDRACELEPDNQIFSAMRATLAPIAFKQNNLSPHSEDAAAVPEPNVLVDLVQEAALESGPRLEGEHLVAGQLELPPCDAAVGEPGSDYGTSPITAHGELECPSTTHPVVAPLTSETEASGTLTAIPTEEPSVVTTGGEFFPDALGLPTVETSLSDGASLIPLDFLEKPPVDIVPKAAFPVRNYAIIAVATALILGLIGVGISLATKPSTRVRSTTLVSTTAAPRAVASQSATTGVETASLAPPLYGSPRVVDTGTLAFGGAIVRLAGIAGEGGIPARQMTSFIAEQGGKLTCDGLPSGLYRCRTPGGYDVAAAALINGAARVTPDASDDYQKLQIQAQSNHRGIWQ